MAVCRSWKLHVLIILLTLKTEKFKQILTLIETTYGRRTKLNNCKRKIDDVPGPHLSIDPAFPQAGLVLLEDWSNHLHLITRELILPHYLKNLKLACLTLLVSQPFISSPPLPTHNFKFPKLLNLPRFLHRFLYGSQEPSSVWFSIFMRSQESSSVFPRYPRLLSIFVHNLWFSRVFLLGWSFSRSILGDRNLPCLVLGSS